MREITILCKFKASLTNFMLFDLFIIYHLNKHTQFSSSCYGQIKNVFSQNSNYLKKYCPYTFFLILSNFHRVHTEEKFIYSVEAEKSWVS